MSRSVAVIGGGAVGLTAAHDLAAGDAKVTLFERGTLASGSTGRAAGICYDAFAGRRDAEVGSRALERFHELGVLTDEPYLWVAHEEDERVETAIREQVEQMQDYGCDVSLVSPEELGTRFPALRTDNIAVGAVSETAGSVDPVRYIEAMSERAGSAGVKIRTGIETAITKKPAVVTPEGTESFDAVLVAAGAWSDELLADVGVNLALGRYRAQALETRAIEPSIPIYYDASAQWYCRPASGGVLAGDGTAVYDGNPDEYDPATDSEFRTEVLGDLSRRFGVDPDVRRSWAGLCTATPDRDPLLGECAPGIYVGTGWHGHGFMRAPALGEKIAEEMLGGEGIRAFDPNRFDGDEAIAIPDGIVE